VKELSFSLPLPPTVNHAYANVGGRRILTSVGRVYKRDVMERVVREIDCIVDGFWSRGEPLSMEIELFFPSLENKGWSSGQAKSRYKQIDASNRVKLVEDAIAEALMIDDRYFFDVTVRKRVRDDEMPPTGCCRVTLQPLTLEGDHGRAPDGGHE